MEKKTESTAERYVESRCFTRSIANARAIATVTPLSFKSSTIQHIQPKLPVNSFGNSVIVFYVLFAKSSFAN